MLKAGMQQYSHLMHFLAQLKEIGLIDAAE
jgi:hypothetical protein